MTGSPGSQRVVLHVGTPKSGTTFLQRALWRHRDELEAVGVTCAGRRHYEMFHAAIELRGSYAFWGRSAEELEGTWQRLSDGAREYPGITIMSHELLGAARREQVDYGLSTLEGLDVHLVVTARDLARQVASDWQERVKNGSPVTFADFCANVSRERQNGFWRNQHLVGVFDRWARDLPPENVHLVVGPPPGSPPNLLWQRFGDAVGFDASAFDPSAEETTANQTLGAVQVAVLRRINEVLDGRIQQPAYSKVVKRVFAQSILAGQSSAPAQCPPALVERLTELTTRQNNRITRRGYQVHGDLDELMPVPGEEPWTDPDAVDPGLETAAAVAAIAELLVEKAAPEAEPEPDPGLVPTARRVGGRVRRRLARIRA
ncbi:hypothetical protein [Nocardioides bizhenqiangii]|uniref:Sulfotransferase family protein n=1 Tax=Nocardioides bizhenqiangii TaxID=3095076 RepID=A0ABZ0ZPB5_9ACTN|nr:MULTISPECIES: hypothetical protein [unclassified Nocardioides]MDZ5621231.1 hypothetical protein [Nocardioides sp. HM23]WQQ25487.1 hypothetical protein SHK19_16150 [Nocardioides sp. HM61]